MNELMMFDYMELIISILGGVLIVLVSIAWYLIYQGRNDRKELENLKQKLNDKIN